MTAGLLTLLAAGLAAGWLFLVLHTAWLLTHPPRRSYAWAVARSLPGDPGEARLPQSDESPSGADGLPFSPLTIRTPDGIDLAAWDIAGANPDGPLIVVSPGWGDSRVIMLSRLPALWPLASRLILFDPRGHGDSAGRCTLGTREVPDLLAVIARARELLHPLPEGGGRGAVPSVAPASSRCRGAAAMHSPSPEGRVDRSDVSPHLVLYGFSLGAGVSIAAAAQDARIAAVIAEAPYRFPITPARNVFRERALPYRTTLAPAMALLGLIFADGPRWMSVRPASAFDRAAHARRLPASTRLLILHAAPDAICPFADAQAIAAAHPGADLVEIAGGDHTTLFTNPASADACGNALQAFIETLAPARNLPVPRSLDPTIP